MRWESFWCHLSLTQERMIRSLQAVSARRDEAAIRREIPADEPTAVNGHWTPGPNADLFKTLKTQLEDLPFIAEEECVCVFR